MSTPLERARSAMGSSADFFNPVVVRSDLALLLALADAAGAISDANCTQHDYACLTHAGAPCNCPITPFDKSLASLTTEAP